MKTVFLSLASFAFLILAAQALTVFSQEPPINFRHFVGFVKDGENKPVREASICGLDLSGRPLNGRIPCTQSREDGSFALGI